MPDLSHILRRQPGAPSLALKQELRQLVDAEVLAVVQEWTGRYLK